MKTEKVMDEILYGDVVYVSAIPVLVLAYISDAFDKFVEYLSGKMLKIVDHRANENLDR